MLVVLAVAVSAMLACLFVQAATVVGAARYIARRKHQPLADRPVVSAFTYIAAPMLVLMGGSVLQMLVWAILYRIGGQFADFEMASYFSGVTFTSLGYGDVVLPRMIRLLAPLEAATGLLMFGITTAVLIAVMQQSLPGRRDKSAR